MPHPAAEQAKRAMGERPNGRMLTGQEQANPGLRDDPRRKALAEFLKQQRKRVR